MSSGTAPVLADRYRESPDSGQPPIAVGVSRYRFLQSSPTTGDGRPSRCRDNTRRLCVPGTGDDQAAEPGSQEATQPSRQRRSVLLGSPRRLGTWRSCRHTALFRSVLCDPRGSRRTRTGDRIGRDGGRDPHVDRPDRFGRHFRLPPVPSATRSAPASVGELRVAEPHYYDGTVEQRT